MPYEIAWEQEGACKRLYGFVSTKEFVQSVLAIQADPRITQARYIINDFTGVTGYDITEADVLLFAAYGLDAFHLNPDVSIAAISTDPAVCRLLDIYASPRYSLYAFRHFPTSRMARAWIAARTHPHGHELTVSLETPEAVDAWHQDWQASGFPVTQAPAQQDEGYTFVGSSPDGHRVHVVAPGSN